MGSRLESQHRYLVFRIFPREEISYEGFILSLVSPCTISQYIGLVRIIFEALLVYLNRCLDLLKDRGLVFHSLRLYKNNKLE
jgi:hypothetical protein